MGKVRKLTASERKAIVTMFPQLGVTETSRRMGCSKSTVQRVWAADAPPDGVVQDPCPVTPQGRAAEEHRRKADRASRDPSRGAQRCAPAGDRWAVARVPRNDR